MYFFGVFCPAQKMKFSIKSHLLKKPVMEFFIFCSVRSIQKRFRTVLNMYDNTFQEHSYRLNVWNYIHQTFHHRRLAMF